MRVAIGLHLHGDFVAHLIDALDVSVRAYIEPLAVELGESLADGLVFAGQQTPTANDHGDAAAHCCEHMRHLCGDVAATEDDEVLGHRRHAHDGVAGVEIDSVESVDVRQCGPGSGGHHDVFSRNVLTVDLDHLGRHEGALAGEHAHIVERFAIRLTARRDRIDATENTVHDVGPTHLIHGGIDAEFRRGLDV